VAERTKVGNLSIVRAGTPPYRAERRGTLRLWFVADAADQNITQIEGSLAKFVWTEVQAKRIAAALNKR
jgi:hypothetical protein